MNIEALMEYDFAQKFVSGKLSEDRFLEALVKKIREDEYFREKTQIFSLENQDLAAVVHDVKATSRRSFVKGAVAASVAVAATGTKAFAQDRIDVRRLFDDISKIPQLKPTRVASLSDDPNAITILLHRDRHGGYDPGPDAWYVNYQQLEVLRTRFHINFIGVEGWAGEEADKKQGYRFLNGETMLVDFLLRDKNYDVVPLEDDKYRRWSFIVLCIRAYDRINFSESELRGIFEKQGIDKVILDRLLKYVYNASIDIYKNNPYKKDSTNRIIFLRRELVKAEKGINREVDKIGNILEILRNKLNTSVDPNSGESIRAWLRLNMTKIPDSNLTIEDFLSLTGADELIRDLFNTRFTELRETLERDFNGIRALLITIFTSLSKFIERCYCIFDIRKLNEDWLVRYKNKVQEYKGSLKLYDTLPREEYEGQYNLSDNYYTLDIRSKIGARKMLKFMSEQNRKIGVIIYGRGHTEGILSELLHKTNNNINILVFNDTPEPV